MALDSRSLVADPDRAAFESTKAGIRPWAHARTGCRMGMTRSSCRAADDEGWLRRGDRRHARLAGRHGDGEGDSGAAGATDIFSGRGCSRGRGRRRSARRCRCGRRCWCRYRFLGGGDQGRLLERREADGAAGQRLDRRLGRSQEEVHARPAHAGLFARAGAKAGKRENRTSPQSSGYSVAGSTRVASSP